MMKILIVIPARYNATRLPGKPLIMLDGKTMIERVYLQAKQASMAATVVVAADDERILNVIENIGGKAMMTSPAHRSGTDRCQEVARKYSDEFDYIINVQGDEPFIHFNQINELAAILDGRTELATLIKKIDNIRELHSPHIVKVIVNSRKEAIYFSRATIPFARNESAEALIERGLYHKHIGMYAYRKDILEKITALSSSPLETAENLEQLRWIEAGYPIKTVATAYDTIGIDTPEDAEEARRRLATLR